MKFQYFVRNVYGAFRAYPANQVADQFAQLLRIKTFSASEIEQISALGFEAEQVVDPRAVVGGAQ